MRRNRRSLVGTWQAPRRVDPLSFERVPNGFRVRLRGQHVGDMEFRRGTWRCRWRERLWSAPCESAAMCLMRAEAFSERGGPPPAAKPAQEPRPFSWVPGLLRFLSGAGIPKTRG